MKQQNNCEVNNQASLTEDLPVNNDQAAAVKGGPIFMNYDGISGDVTSAGHEKWIELTGGPTAGGNDLTTA